MKDSFPTKCIDYVAKTCRELFRFIAARRIKLRAMKEVRVKMGIKEKYDEKKGRNQRKEKKEMRKCEKV